MTHLATHLIVFVIISKMIVSFLEILFLCLILDLLDRSIDADGVQVFIGEESGFKILDDCSVVTAPYQLDDDTIGVLGVIGPTRMAYDRIVPIVDLTARLLQSALRSRG